MASKHRSRALPIVVLGAAVIAGAAFAYLRSGYYNVGADDPHYRVTHALLGQLRDASIRRRAAEQVPPSDLANPARVTQGAGNYDAMCSGCHLAPGMGPTEMSRGLYPSPPKLSTARIDPRFAFWTIKHGIKGSGMPAWGGSIGDDYIWNMAAFLEQLPTLDAAAYRAMVARSGGHSHGGGESAEQHHDESMHDMPGMEAAHDHASDGGGGDAHATDASSAPDAAPAPGTPPQTDASAPHVDPPGTPPHAHDASSTTR